MCVFFNYHVYIIYLWSWYCKVVRFVISSLLVLWSLFVNISIPKSLYIYCFIFYIDIYYDYMYLLLGHVVFRLSTNISWVYLPFLFLYTVCVYACIITMYMYIHTKLVPLPQSTRNWEHYFFLLFKTFHTCIFVTKNEFFIFFFEEQFLLLQLFSVIRRD